MQHDLIAKKIRENLLAQKERLTEYLQLLETARKGYTFRGWSTDPEAAAAKYGNSAKVSKLTTEDGGNVVLYAVWAENMYQVVYNLNGGINNPMNPSTHGISTALPLYEPTRNYCNFEGWYLDSKYKTPVSEIPKGIDGKITVYAKWSWR